MSKTTLNVSEQPSKAPSVGTDITLLLAASSFISPFDNKTDPKATEAFMAVATAYCNGSNLLLPLPRRTVEKDPIFYDLWQRSTALTQMPDVELSHETFNLIAPHGAAAFAAYSEGEAWNVGRWIAFQFTPAVSDVYHQRADLAVIKRCVPIAHELLENGKLTQFRSVINKLQQDDSLRCPVIYEHLIGTNAVPSFMHLCTAWAISVALRGYSYAIALGQYPDAPLYRHHWARSPIVRRIGSQDMPAEIKRQSVTQFPWGEILQRVFDPTEPLADRDPNHVAQVLEGIRDRSPYVRDAMKAGLLSNAVNNKIGSKITDAEVFVLDLLMEVGVSPRYAKSTFLQKAVLWLREISKQKLWFKLPVDLITANLQPKWLRTPESILRMRFKRDSFWKVMEDPGIRKTLQALRK